MDLLGALNDGINYLSVLNTKLGNDLNVHNPAPRRPLIPGRVVLDILNLLSDYTVHMQ